MAHLDREKERVTFSLLMNVTNEERVRVLSGSEFLQPVHGVIVELFLVEDSAPSMSAFMSVAFNRFIR